MFEFIFAVAVLAGLGALFGGKRGALVTLRIAATLCVLSVVGFVIYGFQPNSSDPKFNNWGNCINGSGDWDEARQTYCKPDAADSYKFDPNKVMVESQEQLANEYKQQQADSPFHPQASPIILKKHYARNGCGGIRLNTNPIGDGMTVANIKNGDQVEIIGSATKTLYGSVHVRARNGSDFRGGKTGWFNPANCLNID